MILMIQGLNPLAFTFHPGGLPINLASLCLQFEKISCLEFRVAWLGFSKMLNFSLVHNLQMPFTGLNKGMFFSKNFHSTVGFLPSSFSFQKWVYRVKMTQLKCQVRINDGSSLYSVRARSV